MTTMMTTRLIADFDNTLNDALNGVVEAEAALGRMYRAALARVEAAERDARNDLDDAELHLRRAEAAATALVARVAELEAQLAAQQWRPVTNEWPPYNERVIIGYGGGYGGGWCVFARRVRTDDRDDWLMDDDTTLAFKSAVVAMPRPLPPAPQERTR